jgi:hypothetical protein
MMLDGREPDDRDMLMEELYDDGKAESTALDDLRRHMEERGLKWEADGNGVDQQGET